MEALELIRQEHAAIVRVLECLERAVEDARSGRPLNSALFMRAAEFLRTYVEGAHQAKENALHREMLACGLPRHSGVIAQLAEEHAVGSEHIRAIRQLASEVDSEASRELLLGQAEAYARLHRLHTRVEDAQLLPLAQRLLREDSAQRLRSRFADIEERFGSVEEASRALVNLFTQARAPAAAAALRSGR